MSQEGAKKFFDDLQANKNNLQARIKVGLESLTKIATGYDATEQELTDELQDRWGKGMKFPYSEPAGF